jgi:hypothetical protein
LGGAQVRNHSSLPAFPKIPNLVWVLKKNQDLNCTAIFRIFLGKKKPKFQVSFENFLGHIATVLLVW